MQSTTVWTWACVMMVSPLRTEIGARPQTPLPRRANRGHVAEISRPPNLGHGSWRVGINTPKGTSMQTFFPIRTHRGLLTFPSSTPPRTQLRRARAAPSPPNGEHSAGCGGDGGTGCGFNDPRRIWIYPSGGGGARRCIDYLPRGHRGHGRGFYFFLSSDDACDRRSNFSPPIPRGYQLRGRGGICR